MSEKKLTIRQIAELAGVSKASVSRVLNNYPHISDEIRFRVMQVVEETGYRRNNVATMLARKRSNLIGLVIPSGAAAVFTDPYFPELTRSISLKARSCDQTLALFLCESEQEGVETIQSILNAGLLDGLIITSDFRNNMFEHQLKAGDMPFVFIGRPQHVADVSYIDSDNFNGGVMATEYLIERGYKRIGVIGSLKNTAGDDRYHGYCHALIKHGIPYDEALVVHGDYSMDSGTRAIEQLLPANPDAVFVSSDTMALGVLRGLRERGINVPDEIAIMGHDNLPPAIQADPPLTTIHQHIQEIGELAVETLLQFIANPDRPPRQISLPGKVIVRESTR